MTKPSEKESRALLGHTNTEGFWFRAKEAIVQDFVSPYLERDSRVLILGAGNGATSSRLRELHPNCWIVGVDIDPAAIETCKKRDPQGTYLLSDFEEEDFDRVPQGEFDLVIALDVLEHLRDDAAALRGLSERLRPEGVLVVNVPAHRWLYGGHDVALSHFRRYSPRQINTLIQQQGFALLHSTPLFMTCLVLLIFWRLLVQRILPVRTAQSDVSLEFPPLLDRLLYRVCMMESRVAKRRLPFGSSQLVIARKID